MLGSAMAARTGGTAVFEKAINPHPDAKPGSAEIYRKNKSSGN